MDIKKVDEATLGVEIQRTETKHYNRWQLERELEKLMARVKELQDLIDECEKLGIKSIEPID